MLQMSSQELQHRAHITRSDHKCIEYPETNTQNLATSAYTIPKNKYIKPLRIKKDLYGHSPYSVRQDRAYKLAEHTRVQEKPTHDTTLLQQTAAEPRISELLYGVEDAENERISEI
jgi:hypothetical protein